MTQRLTPIQNNGQIIDLFVVSKSRYDDKDF